MSESEDSKSNLDWYDDEHFSNEAAYIPVTLEWSEEKCLELIREYRQRPVLWDPKDNGYYKSNLKSMAWEEIGIIMGYPQEACKSKMTILLASFRREKSKIIHSIGRGKGHQIYTSNWFGFKDLSFLIDKGLAHKRLTMSDDIQEKTNEQQYYVDNLITRVRHRKTREVASTSHPMPEIVQAFTEIPEQDTAFNAAPQKIEDEEMKYFFDFIGNKMKKYDEQTKNEAQREICEALFKIEKQYYEKKNRTKRKLSCSSSESDPLSKSSKTEKELPKKCNGKREKVNGEDEEHENIKQ